METSERLSTAIADWSQVATDVLEHTPGLARQTGLEFLADSEQSERLDAAVSRLIGASYRVLVHLTPALEEDDPDAIGRLQSLIYGNLAVSDAITAAAEEPEYVAASLRLFSADEFSMNTWRDDIDRAAAQIAGGQVIAGAAVPPVMVSQPQKAIDKLAHAAGGELCGIPTDAAVIMALPELPTAITHVIKGTAGNLVRDASQWFQGAFALAKRTASRVVAWVVSQAHRLLPNPLINRIDGMVRGVVGHLLQHVIPDAIGDFAADLLGKDGVIDAWKHAAPPTDAQVDDATRSPLRNIDLLARGRAFVDRWLRGLLSLISKHPPVALGVLAVAVAALIFVLVQLWLGLRALLDLV